MKETLKDIGAFGGLILVIGFVGYVAYIYNKNQNKIKRKV
jgi:cbb3-type cytochrome oxidase subunit 3